ncbi:MAG TPA: aspartate/glutamate racemase family protein [Chitinophagales bacterium]|nr:aspartate/glutamate racemase family protein [Chitinophagales bacterium]
MTIGICDWGIGGAGLYQLIRRKSNVDVIYFSDTGYAPYGKVPQKELRERFLAVRKYFNQLGIQKIVVACNAASTIIDDDDANITGVIKHGLRVVERIHPARVGVVGGQRTIESNLYKNFLEAKGIKVIQKNAQPLSGLIESGNIDSKNMDDEIKTIFTPLRHLEYILLACTHYPLISGKILSVVKNTTLLDPAEEMAQWIFDHWKNLSGTATVKWQTTGSTESMKFALQHLYQLEIHEIDKINL